VRKLSSCTTQLGPGYFAAVIAAGFDLLAAAIGVVIVCMISFGFRHHRGRFNVDGSGTVDDDTASDVDERRHLISPSGGDVN
jgi:hypothetical protein